MMMMIFIICLVLLLSIVLGYNNRLINSKPKISSSILNDANKEYQKEQQFRLQQEMLARRKDKKKMEKYFEDVETNRKTVDKKVRETIYTKINDNVDPLEKWKQNKAEGKVKKLGYEDVPKSKFFTLQFPQNPIGMENMDNGERFDLRLPYSERGYEDPDADLGNMIGKFMKNVFGGKKK
jgi:hypothetical protein